MKKIQIIFVTLLLLTQYGCMHKKSIVPDSYYAKIYLEVDSSVKNDKALNLYINQEDMNRTLVYSQNNVIYLYKNKNNIHVVQGYKTADINFLLKRGSVGHFKLLETYNKSLIIVQTQTK